MNRITFSHEFFSKIQFARLPKDQFRVFNNLRVECKQIFDRPRDFVRTYANFHYRGLTVLELSGTKGDYTGVSTAVLDTDGNYLRPAIVANIKANMKVRDVMTIEQHVEQTLQRCHGNSHSALLLAFLSEMWVREYEKAHPSGPPQRAVDKGLLYDDGHMRCVMPVLEGMMDTREEDDFNVNLTARENYNAPEFGLTNLAEHDFVLNTRGWERRELSALLRLLGGRRRRTDLAGDIEIPRLATDVCFIGTMDFDRVPNRELTRADFENAFRHYVVQFKCEEQLGEVAANFFATCVRVFPDSLEDVEYCNHEHVIHCPRFRNDYNTFPFMSLPNACYVKDAENLRFGNLVKMKMFRLIPRFCAWQIWLIRGRTMFEATVSPVEQATYQEVKLSSPRAANWWMISTCLSNIREDYTEIVDKEQMVWFDIRRSLQAQRIVVHHRLQQEIEANEENYGILTREEYLEEADDDEPVEQETTVTGSSKETKSAIPHEWVDDTDPDRKTDPALDPPDGTGAVHLAERLHAGLPSNHALQFHQDPTKWPSLFGEVNSKGEPVLTPGDVRNYNLANKNLKWLEDKKKCQYVMQLGTAIRKRARLDLKQLHNYSEMTKEDEGEQAGYESTVASLVQVLNKFGMQEEDIMNMVVCFSDYCTYYWWAVGQLETGTKIVNKQGTKTMQAVKKPVKFTVTKQDLQKKKQPPKNVPQDAKQDPDLATYVRSDLPLFCGGEALLFGVHDFDDPTCTHGQRMQITAMLSKGGLLVRGAADIHKIKMLMRVYGFDLTYTTSLQTGLGGQKVAWAPNCLQMPTLREFLCDDEQTVVRLLHVTDRNPQKQFSHDVKWFPPTRLAVGADNLVHAEMLVRAIRLEITEMNDANTLGGENIITEIVQDLGIKERMIDLKPTDVFTRAVYQIESKSKEWSGFRRVRQKGKIDQNQNADVNQERVDVPVRQEQDVNMDAQNEKPPQDPGPVDGNKPDLTN